MMTTSAVPAVSSSPSPSSYLADPASGLPLREVTIEASTRGGLSRVVLRQRFHNPHAEPLTVSYLFPLPEDAAVSGYAFSVGERRIVGQVDRKADARERFEVAIAEGRTAALLDQERTSLFTQEIGNVPPGAEVTAEITLDQPLRWLDDGSWEWRFPLASAPRFLGTAAQTPDAARVVHAVADGELAVRASYAIRVNESRDGAFVKQAREVALDRDLVVSWAAATALPGATLSTYAETATSGQPVEAFGLLTVVPPLRASQAEPVARDLIVLLDTSGSMGGAPLEQARRVCRALIDTLTPSDQLELIEFGTFANRWRRSAVAATPANKKAAVSWLASLVARGSTEMGTAIREAMSGLRELGQRQVILVTDGQIGFESEVVAAILQRLPVSSRIHTVGVGSAVNRTLTAGAARAGRGVEVIIGLDEDPEKAARRLVARTDAPLVVDVTVSGAALIEHAPARLPDLFAGAPLLVATRLRAAGGELVLRGRTAHGEWTQRVHVEPARDASSATEDAALRAFFARQHVEDLETQLSAGEDAKVLDAAIERAGTRFQIATRLTSWVAVSDTVDVDPRDPTRRVHVPQNLPYGMSVGALGLRPAQAPSPWATRAGVSFGSLDLARRRVSGAPGGFVGSPPPAPSRPSARPAPPRAAAALPPAPAPASARKEAAPTAIRRALDAVGEFFTRGEKERAPRHLRGRLVSRGAGALVVELTAEGGPLEWILGGATVTVHFADGSSARATLLIDRSTREGTVAEGASARAALEISAPTTAPLTRVTLALVDVTLEVILSSPPLP